MRKLLLSTALLGVLFACSSEQKEATSAKLSGTVQDMEDQVLLLYTGENVDTLKLDAQGMFSIEKELSEPSTSIIRMGRKGLKVYLENGFDLNIKTTKKDFSTVAEFTGKGAEESKVLLADNEVMKAAKIGPDTFKLDPVSFVATSDSIMNAELALISGKEDALSADFVELFMNETKYKHLNYYTMYEPYHKYYAKEEAQLPESAMKIVEASKVDSDNLASSEQYVKFMTSTLSDEYRKANGIEEEIEDQAAYFDWLNTKVQSSKLKNKILYSEVKYTLTYVGEEERDNLYKLYTKFNTDKANQELVDKTYSAFEGLRKGKDAPKWAYPDLDGNVISLDDFKGKLVYVDVWATWCGPCKKEIPSLAELSKEYKDKDIVIVSVSVDDNKGAWQKMLAEEEFDWVQIHAEKAWKSDIIKKNQIRGIPRFMMIDKEGKIISVNAPRPSEEGIRDYIDGLL